MTSRSDQHCRTTARLSGWRLVLSIARVTMLLGAWSLAFRVEPPVGLLLVAVLGWEVGSALGAVCRAWSEWKTWRRRVRAIEEDRRG